MGLKLISAPAWPTLTTAEAKAHLRVIDSDDDTLIDVLVKAATLNVENWTGRALVDQTWEFVLDSFPVTDQFTSGSSSALAIQIPKPPLIEITQIAYDDAAGAEQIMDPSGYFVDSVSEPGWVVPTASSWPTTIDAINSVRIRFRAGYPNNASPSEPAVPEDIRAAIKLTLGSLYEHRELQVVGTIASKLPFGAENLLRPYRVLLGMA